MPYLIIWYLIKIPGKLSSVLPKQISFIRGELGEGGQISLKASESCNPLANFQLELQGDGTGGDEEF